MTTEVPSDYVYLDYAATAPLCEEAAAAMAPYMLAGRANVAAGGNANSLHTSGRAAFEALEGARKTVARCVGARRPDEIVFTSGATEADNAAVLGLAHAACAVRKSRGAGQFVPHVITSAIEHDAVLAPVERLKAEGFRVTLLAPNAQGFVSAADLEAALDADTVLVSVQAANSEVGSVQPIAQLAETAHRAGAFFHTDAVQALGKVPCDVQEWGVDAASFSAHKVGGPKGVGALYLKARTPFEPYALGGGQETGRRSGTQNVAGIVGFAAALEAVVANQPAEAARLRALRDALYARVAEVSGVSATVNVPPESADFLPNIAHFLSDDFESETLVLRFDQLGFAVSGGSACSSHSLEPSRVLRAMQIPADRAFGALRVSFGRYTTKEDIKRFADALSSVLDWNRGR